MKLYDDVERRNGIFSRERAMRRFHVFRSNTIIASKPFALVLILKKKGEIYNKKRDDEGKMK
jgi:hypothetical protein